MDKIKELAHKIGIIDAAIANLPKPYTDKIALAVKRQRELQRVLQKEHFELVCIESITNTRYEPY